MDSGFLGMPDDWTPPPAPAVGSSRWKDNMAFQQLMDFGGLPKRNAVFKLLPCEGHELGYFCVRYFSGRGHDYYRVDSIDDITPDKGKL